MKLSLNNLVSIDIFGYDPKLLFNRNEKIKTIFGGILTIMFIKIVLYLIFYFSIDMFNYKNFFTTINEEAIINPSLNFNEVPFFFYITNTSGNNVKFREPQKIFSFNAYFYNISIDTLNKSQSIINVMNLKIGNCSDFFNFSNISMNETSIKINEKFFFRNNSVDIKNNNTHQFPGNISNVQSFEDFNKNTNSKNNNIQPFNINNSLYIDKNCNKEITNRTTNQTSENKSNVFAISNYSNIDYFNISDNIIFPKNERNSTKISFLNSSYSSILNPNHLEDKICINPSDIIQLKGIVGVDKIHSYVRIEISKCENSTLNNFSCLSKTKINEEISNGKIEIRYLDYYLDNQNISFPNKAFLKSENYNFCPFSKKRLKYIIKNFDYITDKALLGYSYETVNFYKFEETKMQSEVLFKENIPFFIMDISLSQIKFTILRRFEKFVSILTPISTISFLVYLILKILCGFFTEVVFYGRLIKNLGLFKILKVDPNLKYENFTNNIFGRRISVQRSSLGDHVIKEDANKYRETFLAKYLDDEKSPQNFKQNKNIEKINLESNENYASKLSFLTHNYNKKFTSNKDNQLLKFETFKNLNNNQPKSKKNSNNNFNELVNKDNEITNEELIKTPNWNFEQKKNIDKDFNQADSCQVMKKNVKKLSSDYVSVFPKFNSIKESSQINSNEVDQINKKNICNKLLDKEQPVKRYYNSNNNNDSSTFSLLQINNSQKLNIIEENECDRTGDMLSQIYGNNLPKSNNQLNASIQKNSAITIHILNKKNDIEKKRKSHIFHNIELNKKIDIEKRRKSHIFHNIELNKKIDIEKRRKSHIIHNNLFNQLNLPKKDIKENLNNCIAAKRNSINFSNFVGNNKDKAEHLFQNLSNLANNNYDFKVNNKINFLNENRELKFLDLSNLKKKKNQSSFKKAIEKEMKNSNKNINDSFISNNDINQNNNNKKLNKININESKDSDKSSNLHIIEKKNTNNPNKIFTLKDVLKTNKSSTIKDKEKDYFNLKKILCKKVFQKNSFESNIYLKTEDYLKQKTSLEEILRKNYEVDKLKFILFDEEMLNLFSCIPNPNFVKIITEENKNGLNNLNNDADNLNKRKIKINNIINDFSNGTSNNLINNEFKSNFNFSKNPCREKNQNQNDKSSCLIFDKWLRHEFCKPNIEKFKRSVYNFEEFNCKSKKLKAIMSLLKI